MSEQLDAPAQAPEENSQAPEETTPEQEAPEIDWKAEAERLRKNLQEARKWEGRAKANAAAHEELEQLRAAQMTEAERAEKRVADAEKRAADLEAQVARREVALKHQLTAEDASLLDSLTDADAMERFAARLAKAAQVADERRHGARVPDAGKKPKSDGSEDLRAFARNLMS